VGRLDEVEDQVLSLRVVGRLNGERRRHHHLPQRSVGPGVPYGRKSKIINGRGTFSEVGEISELFGSYASANVYAARRARVTPPGSAVSFGRRRFSASHLRVDVVGESTWNFK
jgi:hypothetical protein